MEPLFSVRSDRWDRTYPVALQDEATRALEGGAVLFFPDLAFPLRNRETDFLSPQAVRGAKNVSYDAATDKVGGIDVAGLRVAELRGLLGRFARVSRELLDRLCPAYRTGLRQGRTSLRPVE